MTEVFSRPEEHELAKNSLVATFDQGKTWRISFELNPGEKWPQKGNIFQLTTGDKGGTNSKVFGSRSPALFLKKGEGFSIFSSIGDNPNKQQSMGKKNLPPLEEWTPLVFEQREEAGGEFVFAFSQGGVEKFNVTNSDPREFPNMKVTSNQTPFGIELIEGNNLWAIAFMVNILRLGPGLTLKFFWNQGLRRRHFSPS